MSVTLHWHLLKGAITLLLVLFAGASVAQVNSYKECTYQSGGGTRITIACGANACPGGTTYYRTVHEPNPSCNGSCVDMKALGWRKGNKTKFCTNRNYDGVRAYSKHDYSKGGCCFKNPPPSAAAISSAQESAAISPAAMASGPPASAPVK
jgi:hypothetical protein